MEAVFCRPLCHTASFLQQSAFSMLKFPTHFMVTLNDLIICLYISKTDFSPTNSFPWKPKVDAIKPASELRWIVTKIFKKQWYQIKLQTTLGGIHFDADYLSRGTCKNTPIVYVVKICVGHKEEDIEQVPNAINQSCTTPIFCVQKLLGCCFGHFLLRLIGEQ